MPYKKKMKKVKRKIDNVIAHIKSTFNNTILSFTTMEGEVLLNTSAGRLFKGARKGTPFAAAQIGANAAKELKAQHSTRNVEVRVQGPGSGRESLIRSLGAAGLRISTISDVTPLPHNGCRAPKKRRV